MNFLASTVSREMIILDVSESFAEKILTDVRTIILILYKITIIPYIVQNTCNVQSGTTNAVHRDLCDLPSFPF